MSELKDPIPKEVYEKLSEYILSIQYGFVTIVIQDGKIVQIDKNEKFRLRRLEENKDGRTR